MMFASATTPEARAVAALNLFFIGASKDSRAIFIDTTIFTRKPCIRPTHLAAIDACSPSKRFPYKQRTQYKTRS